MVQAEKFKQGNTKLSGEDWGENTESDFAAYQRLPGNFEALTREVKNVAPEIRLQLQDPADYLVFQPIFSYQGYETKIR